MFRTTRIIAPLFVVLWVFSSSTTLAQDDGQAQLDQATEAKLTATSLADLNRVVELIESALAKGLDEPNTEFARQLLGATLLQRGTIVGKVALQMGTDHARFNVMRAKALEDLAEGLKYSPDQPEILLTIARLNVLPGGDVAKAKQIVRKALAMEIDDPRLRANLITLQAALADDVETKRDLLAEAIRVAPNSAAAIRSRGLLRADQGQLERALEDFNRALEIDPKHLPTYEAKVAVLGQLKQYDDALATLDEVERLMPGSTAPLLQKARIHLLRGKPEAALSELNRANQREPANLRILLLRAGVHEETGKTAAALADIDRALELKPDFPPAVRLRATLLADEDRLDEAIAELKRLSESGTTDPLTQLQLAMLLSSAQKHADAVQAYSDVLQAQPENWLALRARADALLNMGKHREAIADYQKALELKPDDVGLLNNYAWVLATSPQDDLRDGQRAVELATRASELTDHQQAHILSTVAAAYAETGDFQKALEWIDKGLEVAGDEHREPLQKERESYQQKKPWRELLGPEDGESSE